MIKGNMSNLLKQAQDVQKKIEEIQNQLADMVVDAEAGGGMVSVKVNGKQEILQINIDPDAIKRSITAKTKAIVPMHVAGHMHFRAF